jgi:very-short-patch-repair endonuclease
MAKKRRNMHLGAKPLTFINAFLLRKNPTEAEILLWDRIKDRQIEGARFRRQHPMKNFVVDNYCHELKLSIEIDGKYHNERSQQFYDDDRTEILNENKVSIIRFTNDQIYHSIDSVIEGIRNIIISMRKQKEKMK